MKKKHLLSLVLISLIIIISNQFNHRQSRANEEVNLNKLAPEAQQIIQQ